MRSWGRARPPLAPRPSRRSSHEWIEGPVRSPVAPKKGPIRREITASMEMIDSYEVTAYTRSLFLLEYRPQRGGWGDLEAAEDSEGEATAGLREAR